MVDCSMFDAADSQIGAPCVLSVSVEEMRLCKLQPRQNSPLLTAQKGMWSVCKLTIMDGHIGMHSSSLGGSIYTGTMRH
jgi:hypothetical protein